MTWRIVDGAIVVDELPVCNEGFVPLINGGDYVGNHCCRCGHLETEHENEVAA